MKKLSLKKNNIETNEQENNIKNSNKKNLRIIIPCACVLICCVIFIIVFITKKNAKTSSGESIAEKITNPFSQTKATETPLPKISLSFPDKNNIKQSLPTGHARLSCDINEYTQNAPQAERVSLSAWDVNWKLHFQSCHMG